MAAMFRSTQGKSIMHGLIEVDVTGARTALATYKAKTGQALSFTAFLTACLAKAVDENREVQAYRLGSNRLIVFDDVDVWVPIEHDVAGEKYVVPYVIRMANHKTVREIHREIRAVQGANIEKALRGPRFLPDALFGLYLWLFSWIGNRYPEVRKKALGTVGLTAVGMFGSGAGWGIPIPPPTFLVTVGGIGEKPGSVDGQITLREYLSLTVSVDHDLVDGAPTARFTRRLRELIEGGYGLDDVAAEPALVGADGMSKQKVVSQ
jgi:pyruvate/2-oxoglutarate dehydrogenase complex dihydrolipoamide acyltransferase (E2) component